jgi:hypothetical protein
LSLPEYVAEKPANIALRSQYSLRLYAWAKKYVSDGTQRISLEDLRKVLGLQSVKDAEGNVIQEAPLPIWANFRQRALDIAVVEITKKTDLRSRLNRWNDQTSMGDLRHFFDSGAKGAEGRLNQ